MEKKERKMQLNPVVAYILLAVTAGAAVMTLAVSITGLGAGTGYEKLAYEFQAESEEGSAVSENNVVISDLYTIRSTENISEAYKSGDESGLDEKDREVLTMASGVLDSIITPDMTEFEKEKAVYDWMSMDLAQDEGMMTVIPETEDSSDSPYGVLKYGNAVCVGYATTFRLFMQMMDIPCMVVHSTDLGHSWNLVQLDGEWYHTDVYFDAGMGNYSGFNMNDEMCMAEHTWDTEFFPEADGIKYNMAYIKARDIDDIYDIPGGVRNAIDSGETVYGVKFKGDAGECSEVVSMMSMITERLGEGEEGSGIYVTYRLSSLPEGEDGYLLGVYIARESAYDEVSYETSRAAEDAVERAFGSADEGVYSEDEYEETDNDPDYEETEEAEK